ncbi:hypothetical protein O0I10_010089 [Lichtheimia ornata]|uniref:Microtubule binding protein n=1 Tax=Lichtheimia ornata TaxID=688661 RepID=A0AAD7UVN4_9FUNG|nr:uncharacterized protein O0I10_010089 [Lichtheimia ornata]KAJ8654267.1 hypothetical protein O0I10_010089 [Lichtheimia ornata]
MSESRNELLAWINDLLQLNYRKVEQAGTGAAYCQIIDSIYGDVHMSKVKFDTKHEYEYVGNYKVLQNAFDKHKIDKVIPVDRLMKCKLQDNLEFTQWLKRYWDQTYPGGDYDALQRRKGGAGGGGGRASSRSGTAAPAGATRKALGSPAKAGATARSSSRNGGGVGSMDGAAAASTIADLKKQVSELKLAVDGLEKERDFYFGKLRQVEILVQEQMGVLEQQGRSDEGLAVLRDIQNVLYSTEDGFEAPPEDHEGVAPAAGMVGGVHQDFDDETF